MKLVMRNLFLAGVVACLLVSGPAQAADTALVNLQIDSDGMYRITYEQLAAEGADLAGVKHRHLALAQAGQKVAIRTVGMQGADKSQRKFFGPGGYLEFYGVVKDQLYSDKSSYTLHLSKPLRRTMKRQRLARYNRTGDAAEVYQHQIEVEENRYYDFLSPSRTDPWHYGQQIAVGGAEGPEFSFELPGLMPGPTQAVVQAFGLVDLDDPRNDHHIAIVINDAIAGDEQFDGNRSIDLSLPTEGGALNLLPGTNTVRMDLIGIADMPLDAVALNKLTISYPRASRASENRFAGTLAQGQTLITGFDSRDITVYSLDRSGTPTLLARGFRPRSSQADGSFAVGLNVGAESVQIVATASDGWLLPSVEAIAPEQDITSGSAEYLILSHAAFRGAELDAFAQMRAQTSQLDVKIVDVAQIYAQFGNYQPDAAAIHDYVKFAAANLGTRYVLLVGGDQYDYKNYQSSAVSHVPTLYATTPGGLLLIQQNPVDSLFGDLDADEVPDIPVGRLPARNLQELDFMLEKIYDFQAQTGYAARAVVVADIDDNGNGISFVPDGERLVEDLPDDWQDGVVTAFAESDGAQTAKDNLLAALNGGVTLASYVGHSSEQRWSRASPPLLTSAEIASLVNIDQPAVVTQWGCWNTYFVKPSSNSMSQSFLLSGFQGAATVLGASSLTSLSSERALSSALMPRLIQSGITIGDAVIAAKQQLGQTSPQLTDVLLGWQILGDPALVLNP